MRNPTKKITAYFFLLLGLAPLVAAFSFTIQQRMIRHRMKEKLEYARLQTVIIPEDEVIWMDKHEIWVNDHMFDIHSKKLTNGVYTFTGLYDEDETILVKNQLDFAEENEDEHESSFLTHAFKCLQTIYHEQLQESHRLSAGHHTYPQLASVKHIHPFRKIITPPPQLVA